MKKILCSLSVIFFLTTSLVSAIEPVSGPPREAYIYYLKGLMYEKQRKIPEAIAVYQRLIKLDRNSKVLRRELISLYLSSGNVSAALATAEELKKLDEKDAQTYLSFGEIYMFNNDRDQAKKMYEEALKYDPQNQEALMYLAHLNSEDNPEQASNYYQKLLELEPNSPEMLFNLAPLYIRLKKYDEALDICQKIINLSLKPEALFIAYLTAGQIYEEKKDWDKTIEAYRSAWKLEPQNINLLIKLGSICYEQKKYVESEEYFTEVLKLNPESVESRYFLSLLAETQKKWDKALSLFLEIVNLQKDNIQAYLHLGYLYTRKGDLNRAVSTLEKATKIDPNNPEVFFFLGLGYEDLKKYKEAERSLLRAITLKPDYAGAYYHLGSVYDQQGLFEKAVTQFRKVISLDSSYWAAYNYIGYSYADRNINLDEAYELIKKAIDAEPDNGAFVDSLGWVYYRQGKNKEAIDQLEKANKLITDPIIAEHLGDVYYSEKKYEEAVDTWEKSQQLNPNNPLIKNKLKKVQNLVLPGTWIRKRLKTFEGNQKQIGSLKIFLDIEITTNKTTSNLKTIFYYKQPEKVRIDFLGLFALPKAVLLGDKEMILYRPEGKDIGLTESEVFALAESLKKWLNGDLTMKLDTTETSFNETKTSYHITNKNVEADLSKDQPVINQYSFSDLNNNRIELEFGNYSKIEGLWLPEKIRLSLKGKDTILIITLSGYEINSAIGDVFQLTQQ